MNNLIDILRTETQTLKNKYFEMTEFWAKNSYKVIQQRKNWNTETWCSYLNITPEIKNPGTSLEHYGFPKGFYNTSNSKKYKNMIDEIRRVVSMGEEKYIQKELKKADQHYETSLKKLTNRIELKNLNIEKMKIVTGYVGVNIDMTLSDGEKVVKAFTIIAEGTIQRPHYRYLLK